MDKAIEISVQANVPILLWGAPGVGKSSAIVSLAQSLGWPFEVVIASIREPSDFLGLPIIVEGDVQLAPPAWARRLSKYDKGVLFFDEISTVPPAVQAALLRVVFDRVVGDIKLPDGIRIIAAANPPEQAANGWDLSHPLANRFVHLNWELNAFDWVNGMVSGWKLSEVTLLPPDWEKGLPGARALIAAFIKVRPGLLLVVPNNESEGGLAWASPRSWDMAARLWAACDAVEADFDTRSKLIVGAVGSGVGMEFLNWVRTLDLPDPEIILASPNDFKLPKRGDLAFALLSAVATAAINNLTPERWMAAWEVMLTAANQGGRDVAAVAVKILAAHRSNKLPLPIRELQPFIELLEEGKLM